MVVGSLVIRNNARMETDKSNSTLLNFSFTQQHFLVARKHVTGRAYQKLQRLSLVNMREKCRYRVSKVFELHLSRFIYKLNPEDTWKHREFTYKVHLSQFDLKDRPLLRIITVQYIQNLKQTKKTVLVYEV